MLEIVSKSIPTQITTPPQPLCFREVYHFLEALFDDDLHAKRILSLADATEHRKDVRSVKGLACG